MAIRVNPIVRIVGAGVALGGIACVWPHSAMAQSTAGPSGTIRTAAKPAATQPAATLSDEAPDPLTPKRGESPAPTAPGAPSQVIRSDAPAHPAIVAMLERPNGTTTRVAGDGDDRRAVAAHYAANGSQPVWTADDGLSPRGSALAAGLARAPEHGLDAASAYATPAVGGAFAGPEARADAELALSLAALRYARDARGGRVDPARLSRMIDMKPRPFEPMSVLAALADAPDVGQALANLHPRHPEFANLRTALASARAGGAPAETIQRILVNLERWRWVPDDFGAFHVRNNIPEQLTRVYRDNEVVFTERIVVGKPNTPTPMMSADMHFVIFHPSWGVPNGIKNNEVGPMLRRASSSSFAWFGESGAASRALGRHQLRVYRGGQEINPDNVDWRAVDINQFHFTQPPSAKNVLGVVKFRFPNKYDVYMHDTQERNLFSQSVRAYSHGCMRVQNPLKLAEVILGHDKGWNGDRVRAAVSSGRSSDITLSTPVPVHLLYFTATADETGKLTLHGDIYGQDQRVATALAGKPVQLASAPSATPAPRKQTAVRVRTTSSTAAQPFNPFAGLFGN